MPRDASGLEQAVRGHGRCCQGVPSTLSRKRDDQSRPRRFRRRARNAGCARRATMRRRNPRNPRKSHTLTMRERHERSFFSSHSTTDPDRERSRAHSRFLPSTPESIARYRVTVVAPRQYRRGTHFKPRVRDGRTDVSEIRPNRRKVAPTRALPA